MSFWLSFSLHQVSHPHPDILIRMDGMTMMGKMKKCRFDCLYLCIKLIIPILTILILTCFSRSNFGGTSMFYNRMLSIGRPDGDSLRKSGSTSLWNEFERPQVETTGEKWDFLLHPSSIPDVESRAFWVFKCQYVFSSSLSVSESESVSINIFINKVQ